MFATDQVSTVTTPGNQFRRLLAEHYLRRAEECLAMARHGAARKILGEVFSLDPANRQAQLLQKRIEESLQDYRGNGKSSARKARRSEAVLVVDQDERVLTSLIATLRKYGFGAIGAAGFSEALEALSTVRPDVIVSEVNFEDGPVGFDLYLSVRTNSQLHDIPFLYLATRVTRELVIASKRLGVDDIVTKPVDAEVVIASVVNCLARRRKNPPTV